MNPNRNEEEQYDPGKDRRDKIVTILIVAVIALSGFIAYFISRIVNSK